MRHENEQKRINMDKTYFNLRQAATYLGVSIHTMRHYAADRKFTLYRQGGKLLFVDKDDLDNWRLSGRIEPNVSRKVR